MPAVHPAARPMARRTPGVRAPAAAPTLRVVEGRGARILDRIADADVHLAVWRRAQDPSFARALAKALALLSGERVQAVDARGPDLDGFVAPFPADLRGPLRSRLRTLVRIWSRLDGRHLARLKLSVIRGAECKKFHVDRVGLRLLSTLAGPGTVWAPESAVDRRFLGAASAHLADPNARICPDPRAAGRLRAGDVGVFKGELAAGNGRGIVHRSPDPVGSPRLLVCVDDGFPLADPHATALHHH